MSEESESSRGSKLTGYDSVRSVSRQRKGYEPLLQVTYKNIKLKHSKQNTDHKKVT